MRDLPEGWVETTLGEAVDICSGKTRPKQQGAYPVYGGNGILNYGDKFNQEGETIIVGRVGAYCGNVFYETKPFWLSDNALGVKAKEVSHEKFLYYKLVSMKLNNHAIGGAQPLLTQTLLKELEINLPPLPEQKAIADMLSSFDEKIELLREQNKTLETLAQTIFEEWFVNFNYPDATGEMVDSELGEIPKGWRVGKLGNVIKTNTSSINKNSALDVIQYLDTGSLTEGHVESTQELHLADAPSRARRIVQHNDVLISTVRPNLKHYGIIKEPDENLIVSTGFCVITCDEIDPHFVYYLLTTNEMTDYLHSVAEGSTSTYPSIKPSDIEKVEFVLPPEDILKLFSDYADKAWDKIMFNQKQIKSLSQTRDTLLPKLMNGGVRVNE